MSENYNTIQHLRGRIQDLEKYKYVLGYKVETYQAELLPKAEEAARLAQELVAHDKELALELAHIKELRMELGEKDRSIRILKTNITDIRCGLGVDCVRLHDLLAWGVSSCICWNVGQGHPPPPVPPDII